MTPTSESDTTYLPYCTTFSRHTEQPIETFAQPIGI
jgi:hypothetical protein